MDALILYGVGIPVACIVGFLAINAFKIIRPTHKGLIERFGKYNRFVDSGLTFIIPFMEKVVRINITETMVDAKPQEIITLDNLNAMVDAQVYFKVKTDEISVKACQYNVNNYQWQIVNLARTTLRNIIGTMSLKEANSERGRINSELMKILALETKNWGIEVVRTELKEISPPQDVQETMNKVVKAYNEKTAAIDFATATETKADGERRARIKEAEGLRQSLILEAEGKSKAFELIHKSFIGNAQILRKLEVAENSLKNNSKIILPEGKSLINVIGSLSETLGEKKVKEGK